MNLVAIVAVLSVALVLISVTEFLIPIDVRVKRGIEVIICVVSIGVCIFLFQKPFFLIGGYGLK